jgi:hypothetical protein
MAWLRRLRVRFEVASFESLKIDERPL